MKHTPLAKKSKSPVAQCKDRIQDLLRAIAIERDGGCVLGSATAYIAQTIALRYGFLLPHCNGYRKDGELILQYDHLNSRAFNVSYADVRLGVILCKGHHGWKHMTDANKKFYDRVMREIIEPDRTALWDRVEEDRKTYHMTLWDWQKIEIALAADLGTRKAA
jgi:hypothetical protein